ncbi:MAG: DUF6249 domain-containing protein [Bacteroidales bacterium]|jgi:hypothetical protein|nr:DUF6249 domain-containing protein [Bacteroidales bacterium]
MKKVFLVCMLAFISLLSFGQSQNPFDFLTNHIFLESFTGIVAIASIIGLPILIIYIVYRYKINKKEIELVEKCIEDGKDIPDDYFKKKIESKNNTFGKAMTYLSVGIGLAIIFWVLFDIRFATIGLLFILIGIGRLVTYFMEKSEKSIS